MRVSVEGRRLAALLGRLQPLRVKRDLPPHEEGWLTATFRLESIEGAAVDILTLGPEIEVVEPPELRERVVDALYAEHRATFGRIAMITRLLPTPLNVRITLRAFSPLLAARIAGEMAPDRAAELVNRMPIEYLADGCVHLEPRRAAPLISHIDPDRVVAA